MADLHDVVAGAVASAVESGDIPATPSEGDTDSGTPDSVVDPGTSADPVGGEAVSPTDGSAATPAKEPAKPAKLDEIDKLLAANDIKPVDKHGRENRIPYKNVRRITENAEKRAAERVQKTLSEHQGKIQTYEGELHSYRQSDDLARRDPDRFMELLGLVNPAFKAYRKGGESAAATTAVQPEPVSKLGPRPEPDAKFPDGSLGYSPEQHEKLMDWVEARAEERAYTRAQKEFDTRFGPIEKDWKTAQQVSQLAPRIENQMANMSRMWGKLFDEEVKRGNSSDILKYMNQYGTTLEFATSAVLLPRINRSQDEMRTSLLAEINERPAAAASAAATSSVRRPSDASRTMADVVREATSGLK